MSISERLCPVCDRVVPPDAPVSLLHGEVLHKECFDRTMGAQKPRRPRRPERSDDGAGRDGAGQQ